MATTKSSSDFKSMLGSVEKTLDVYLVQKAPALPKNVKEAIVQYGPWITIIIIVLALPAIFAALGLGTLLAPVSFFVGVGFGFNYMLTMILVAIAIVLEIMAVPGLFKRQRSAWNFMFYSTLVSGLSNLVSYDVFGLIIGMLLSLYILFQVKEYYR